MSGSFHHHNFSSQEERHIWAQPKAGAGWGGRDMLPYELDREIGLLLPRPRPEVGFVFDLRAGVEDEPCYGPELERLLAGLGAVEDEL